MERNQVTGRDDRINFQDRMLAAIADMNRQLAQLTAQVAGIAARLDERDRVSVSPTAFSRNIADTGCAQTIEEVHAAASKHPPSPLAPCRS